MIGGIVFLIFFFLLSIMTLSFPYIPPGNDLQRILHIPYSATPVWGYSTWVVINAILNGLVYGVTMWIVFSIAKYIYEKRKE